MFEHHFYLNDFGMWWKEEKLQGIVELSLNNFSNNIFIIFYLKCWNSWDKTKCFGLRRYKGWQTKQFSLNTKHVGCYWKLFSSQGNIPTNKVFSKSLIINSIRCIAFEQFFFI